MCNVLAWLDSPSACWGLSAYLPLLLVFMSGFGFSIQGLLIKILEESGFKASFELIIIRGFIQASVSYAIIRHNKNNGETASLFGDGLYPRSILALRAIFGWGGIGFGFLAIEHLPIADASVLLMQSPVLAAILGYVILGEPWRLPEFCSTLVSMTGVVLIAKPHFIFDHLGSLGQTGAVAPRSDSLGPVFGLLAAFSAGSAFVMVRLLGTSAKMPWANVGFATALAQVILSVPVLFVSGQKATLDLGVFEWSLLLIGGVTGTVSQLAMTIGMQREKSASASAMRTSDVFFAFIWQVLFTSDPVTALSVSGAVLVMVGVMIIVVFRSKSSRDNSSEQKADSEVDEGSRGTGRGSADVIDWVWSIISSNQPYRGVTEIAMTTTSSLASKHSDKKTGARIQYSRVSSVATDDDNEV